jgi:16S rRNA (guanine527-N7)-methyltransferase
LVGRSTLENPWASHILDSLQILPHLKNKKVTILDMGTGAGFPGAVLSIAGCENVTLVDSNGKKINFLKQVKKDLLLNFNTTLGRLEKLNNLKYDVLTSRALANLDNLFSYSQKFLKKNTVMIFLKGKTVNKEIQEAQKRWTFHFNKSQSASHVGGTLLVVRNLKKND